jgi:NAD+ kinase
MEAVDASGAVHAALALNDVYVERERGQTCHLRVTVDGVEVVERMVCDGLIVATALGSTAYTFSAGGPAAHPLLRALHLTAICPHSPRLPPLVLPETSVVEVEVIDAERRPARVVVDGAQTGDIRRVRVRGGADAVRIAFLEGHDFIGTMVGKVLRGG